LRGQKEVDRFVTCNCTRLRLSEAFSSGSMEGIHERLLSEEFEVISREDWQADGHSETGGELPIGDDMFTMLTSDIDDQVSLA
jgi:hypothetical protein